MPTLGAPVKRLEGKSAIVTGAASGIGRATSLLFAQHGAKLIVVDRAPEVQATADAINQSGGRAVALVKDVSSEADVESYIQAALREHGGRKTLCTPMPASAAACVLTTTLPRKTG